MTKIKSQEETTTTESILRPLQQYFLAFKSLNLILQNLTIMHLLNLQIRIKTIFVLAEGRAECFTKPFTKSIKTVALSWFSEASMNIARVLKFVASSLNSRYSSYVGYQCAKVRLYSEGVTKLFPQGFDEWNSIFLMFTW